ncbi:MAG: cupin domain-containing protein [bacterium]
MNEQQYDNLSASLLGAGDKDKSKDWSALLQQASAEERAGMHELARIFQALPYSLEQHVPPATLKEKILADAKQHEAAPPRPPVQLWKSWITNAPPADLVIQRRDEGAWEDTGVEGVAVKQLFVDPERGYVTMLVRMAAGSSYPSHRHAGYEECYVLQGDLSVGESVLHAGDYQRAEGGSVHVVQSTNNGCLLFIVSSQNDELLA